MSVGSSSVCINAFQAFEKAELPVFVAPLFDLPEGCRDLKFS